MGRAIGAHGVDIDTLLQEAIRHAEAKVIPHGVLVQGHLGQEEDVPRVLASVPGSSHCSPDPYF